MKTRSVLAVMAACAALVTSAASADPLVAPDAQCAFQRQTGFWLIAVTGHAGSDDVAVSTSVSCTITDANGEEVVAQASSIGPAVVATGAEPTFIAPIVSVCTVLTVEYLSGVETVENCEEL